jgi:hypothetical protein
MYVNNEPVTPAWDEPRLFEWRWAWVLKTLLVIGVFVRPMFIFELKIGKYWIKRPQNAIVGNYQVAQFVRQGDTVPAFLGDSTRWNAVFISVKDSAKGSLMILRMDNTSSNLGLELDSVQHRITVMDKPVSMVPLPKSKKTKKADTTAKAKGKAAIADPTEKKDEKPKDVTPPPPKKIGLLDYLIDPNGDVRLTGKVNNINYDVKLTRIVNEKAPLWRGTRPFAVPR